ncbi:hypothetical protein [Halogeometricum limi]|uniref:Uncharacterized protein n=1 Tax=Halogeometricum limi TaxID=555875 RepID=A0A1I6IFF0_9EURY|nr:hypothetical protein [Halogeometricum limi]SFR65428.1 hypothetical protein SAMN04488124_3188 [Halogeometricum limi]
MGRLLATAAAILAALLMLVALALAANGNLMIAGLSFLGASLVIYFRETTLVDD